MRKLLYLVMLAVTVYLNLVYEWREGRYILTIEIIFPVILYIHAKLLVIKVRVYPCEKPQIAEEGESIRIPFSVENYSIFWIPVFWMWIGKQKIMVQNLKKGRRIDLSLEYQSEICGKKQIKIRKMEIMDAAGLFRIRHRIDKNIVAEVHVIPKIYPVAVQVSKDVRLFESEGEEYDQQRGGGHTSEIFQIREYQPGDKVSRIHWKLSARMDKLYMKEFSLPISASVILLIDHGKKEIGEKTGSLFLSLAASTGYAMVEESCRFYAVWKERNSQVIRRILVKDEESFYEWLLTLSSIEISKIDEIDEAEYQYEFYESYRKVVKIRGDLTIQCGESQEMVFHEHSFAKQLGMTVLEI